MRDHHGYLPDQEAQLVDWLDNFVQKVQANYTVWQIPEPEVTEIAQKAVIFKGLHTKCAGSDRTKRLVAEKNAAKADVVAKVREMVDFRFANPAIPDASRVECGLHIKDTAKSAIPAPQTRALITEVLPLGGFRVEIRFHDEAAPDSRAIPYGMNGGLLNYTWGAEKTADYGLLKDSKLMTASPFTLQLSPSAEGAFLSCACRWQNKKGELGPWSEIMTIAVS